MSAAEKSMILQATHTHLYPGHEGKICGLTQIRNIPPDCDCQVEFSDGSAATARISRHDNKWRLHTDAYRTAAGTNIPQKLWLISLVDGSVGVEFRILGKA